MDPSSNPFFAFPCEMYRVWGLKANKIVLNVMTWSDRKERSNGSPTRHRRGAAWLQQGAEHRSTQAVLERAGR